MFDFVHNVEIRCLEESLQVEKVLARYDDYAAEEVFSLEQQINDLKRECFWLNF